MNARTRLKMVVNTVAQHSNDGGPINAEEITLSAVYSDKEGAPNKLWSKWTPTGQLKFTVTNEAVMGTIRPGMFFFVDLTQCEKDSM